MHKFIARLPVSLDQFGHWKIDDAIQINLEDGQLTFSNSGIRALNPDQLFVRFEMHKFIARLLPKQSGQAGLAGGTHLMDRHPSISPVVVRVFDFFFSNRLKFQMFSESVRKFVL